MFKTNTYFDGNVVSIAFQTETLPATVGVMAPGAYTFDTSKLETVTVVSGALDVHLPGEESWRRIAVGDTFQVPADAEFQVKVDVDTAYLCTYA